MSLSPPTLVLMYHRIAQDPPDPHGLQVRPENFLAQLSWLREIADVEPIECLSRRTVSRPRVIVTLDDGYVDNLATAKPILEDLGVPATVFVTSGLVGNREGFWQDQLIDLLLKHDDIPTHIEIEVSGSALRAHVGSGRTRQRIYTFLHRRLRREAPAAIARAMQQLIEQVGVRPNVATSALPLSREELRTLTAGGLVSVGAHTVHHAMLARLGETAQTYEIRHSAADLAEMVGGPVTTFAYPFGRSGEYDSTSVRIASESYEWAFTSEHGAVSQPRDRFELPRIYVGDWDASTLRRRLGPFLS